MKEKTNKEKFLDLVAEDASETRAWIRERNKNRKFYRTSQKIALNILKRLEELSWTQKDLAKKMEVSPQQVNKWVKGSANFKLDTLINLGTVLDVDLITSKSLGESKAETLRVSKTNQASSSYQKDSRAVTILYIKTDLVATNPEEHYSKTRQLA